MMCPVCKRDLAPTLSICLTCGAMMNDSVREELHSKPAAGESAQRVVRTSPPARPELPPQMIPAANKAAARYNTADLASKKTSPTLAEFRTKNAAFPDWRLQLQNSVRQRTGRGVEAVASPPKMQTSGANALKAQYVEEVGTAEPVNIKVANALKRIEESRRASCRKNRKKPWAAMQNRRQRIFRSMWFPGPTSFPPKPLARATEPPAERIRPKLVSSLRIEKKTFDTNKLVPIPEAAKMASSLSDAENLAEKPKLRLKENWSERVEIKDQRPKAEVEPEVPALDETENDGLDDLAPVAMRFNAGFFDLIIGAFGTFVLLSPFLFSSEGWISLSGFLFFAAAMAVVMFLYLTASVSYFGRTFGMKLFSLELVDAEQSEYPTLHQAAVSSSVYLLSLAAGGLGFIPMMMNEEKRAAHDLISGTILIREF